MKNTVKKSVESFKRGLCWAWGHKLRVAVMGLVLALIAPRPVRSQILDPCGRDRRRVFSGTRIALQRQPPALPERRGSPEGRPLRGRGGAAAYNRGPDGRAGAGAPAAQTQGALNLTCRFRSNAPAD